MSQAKPAKNNSFKLSNYLNVAAFDMFGSAVQFNINGDQSFKTILGVFWSILMVGAITFASLFYISIYYYKSDVAVTQINEVQSFFPLLNFTEKNFVFSIYANKDKKVLPPNKLNDLVSFEAIQYVYNTTTNSTTNETQIDVTATKINLELCGVNNDAGRVIDGTTFSGKNAAAISSNAYCTVPDRKNETKQEMYVKGTDTS